MAKKKELTLSDLRKMGGDAVKKKYGKKHFAELGRKSGAARRKKAKAVKTKGSKKR